MKRLIKNNNVKIDPIMVGDWVIMKNNRIDLLPYKVINILNNNTLVLHNNTGTYSGIKPSTVKIIDINNNENESD